LLPLPAFAANAAVGIVNLTSDKSGTPRGVRCCFEPPTRSSCRSRCVSPRSQAGSEPIIEADGLRLADKYIPTDIDHVLPLVFYGEQGTVPTISAAALLNSDVAAASLKDRIVVIGVTVTGSGDVFPRRSIRCCRVSSSSRPQPRSWRPVTESGATVRRVRLTRSRRCC
jgi:adenylate cyclase